MFDKYEHIVNHLYRPSTLVKGIVKDIICELKSKGYSYGDVIKIDGVGCKVSKINIRSIELEDSHCQLLIHWVPNFHISTLHDPMCSAFILRYNSLKKLLRYVKNNIENKNNSNFIL